MKHISIRVPWHENRWNGTVCKCPHNNPFCTCLKRIQQNKDSVKEEKTAGKKWSELSIEDHPSCITENGGFMSPTSVSHIVVHPINDDLHKVLKPTTIEIPPFFCMPAPFRYFSLDNQDYLNERYPNLSLDEDAPFHSAWVYGRQRQFDIANLFRNEIVPGKSLAVFYTKSGNPIDEDSPRLIVGIGMVSELRPIVEYESNADYTYPVWNMLLGHSIRPEINNSNGFLLPYHEYLELDSDLFLEKAHITKEQAIDEIKLSLSELDNSSKIMKELSYGCDYVSSQSMLTILQAARKCLEKVIDHQLVIKDWTKQVRWIDEQIAHVKLSTGPFPSFAEALRAFGFNYAYLIEHDLREVCGCGIKDNPWEYFDKLMKKEIELPEVSYSAELKQYRDIWKVTDEESMSILQLLSRFDINSNTINYWYEHDDRWEELLANPYVISEESRIDDDEYVTHDVIDIGCIQDADLQGKWIPDKSFAIESLIDERRIRALVVERLKLSLMNGDTLLSISELMEYIGEKLSTDNMVIPKRYFHSTKVKSFMEEKLVYINSEAIQLMDYRKMEDFLKSRLEARAKTLVSAPVKENWDDIVIRAITNYREDNPRSVEAAKKQIEAVKTFCQKKLSVLTGSAGTGKTTVVKAFLKSTQIQHEGVLLLAPTGKARVRLGSMSLNTTAQTIAQFLTQQGVYDVSNNRYCGINNIPKNKYCTNKNIIIDECSMITTEELYYLISVLDLTKINRIILIGDPYQLPPIGAGRPFSDLCAYLQTNEDAPKDALVELTAVVRTITEGESDILALASHFRDGIREKNADMVFDKIAMGELTGDLSVYHWENEEDLYGNLESILNNEFSDKGDTIGDRVRNAMGLGDLDLTIIQPEKVEGFQLLTPVREPMWGAYPLNNLFQKWLGLEQIKYYCTMFPQKIHYGEKVMQLKNEKKVPVGKAGKKQLSNGQIGFTTYANNKGLKATFSGLPNDVFQFYPNNSDDGDNVLELAYAITIHKSQGSDFDTVLVVLPKFGRIISRELIYTALTRAKKKLILMVQGSAQEILKYSMPASSELMRRNSNLFQLSVRNTKHDIPYVEGLIHHTKDPDIIVRSKSEVIIANELITAEIPFEYEKILERNERRCIPDFSFETPNGERIIWEHLGMLGSPSYFASWKKKLAFYKEIGFEEGKNLFTTMDHEDGSFNTAEVLEVIDKIKELL